MFLITLLTGLLAGFIPANAIKSSNSTDVIWQNKVFKKGIETVLIYPNSSEMAEPIIELGSNEKIILLFDEIGTTINDYSWTIEHCNSNWNSSNLNQLEYIDGFVEGNIDDYSLSQNTMVNYVNYRFEFPTETSAPLISGNYILKVYERNNTDNLVLTRRFYIYETMVEIEAHVDQLKIKTKNGLNQRISLELNCNDEIENPGETLQLKIYKNAGQMKDFAEIKPTFINGNYLKFEAVDELAFTGGNEYRHVDIKNFNFVSDRISNIDKHQAIPQVYLRPDENRSSEEYNFQYDLNGRKLVKLEKNEKSNIMADYCEVYFRLDVELPLYNGDCYIYGALTDWDLSTKAKMNYDFNKNAFTAKLLLKQGYYNYIYLFKTEDKLFNNENDLYNFEGNYPYTENDYHLMVYYKGYSSNYDKLVGYKVVNSTKNANY